ncbi:MAG: hypothetical protein WBX00_24980 [Isosphaeraceae bacterium]
MTRPPAVPGSTGPLHGPPLSPSRTVARPLAIAGRQCAAGKGMTPEHQAGMLQSCD